MAIVHERVAVLLDVAPDDPVVSRVSELVLAGAGVDDVLDALVTSGLKGLVDFGAFEVRPDGVRLVVRGRVSGSVGALAGVVSQHTMWHDTWQPGQQAAALSVEKAEGPSLPMVSGVALAATISVGDPVAGDIPAAAESLDAPSAHRHDDGRRCADRHCADRHYPDRHCADPGDASAASVEPARGASARSRTRGRG